MLYSKFELIGFFTLIRMPARDPKQEREILDWIEAVMGEKLPAGEYDEVLKNGVVLCKLMNKISPGAITKFKEKGPAFLLMENIGAFQKAVKAYGVPDEEIFQTPDLFEGRNIPQVTLCLYALGRTTQKHSDYNGPQIGPKMSEANKYVRWLFCLQKLSHNSHSCISQTSIFKSKKF